MLGAKVRVEKLENPQLGRGDRGVIDKLAFSQPRKRALELVRADELHRALALDEIGNRLDVQIKNIDEQPARGAVGARVRRVVREKCVQRIDACDVGAFCRPDTDQRREIGEVANAPVTLGTHAIELRGRAPDAATVGEGGRRKTRDRHDDEQCFRDDRAAGLQGETVISERRLQRQQKLARDQLNTLQGGPLRGEEITRCEIADVLGAAFLGEAPLQRRRIPPRVKVNAELRLRALAHDHRRRDDLAPLRGDAGGKRAFDFLVGGSGDVHRREQGAQCRLGNGVQLAPNIVVLQRDAVKLGEARERAHALFRVNLTEQAGSTSLPASSATG